MRATHGHFILPAWNLFVLCALCGLGSCEQLRSQHRTHTSVSLMATTSTDRAFGTHSLSLDQQSKASNRQTSMRQSVESQTQTQAQAGTGSMFSLPGNSNAGRGLGPGRFKRPYEAESNGDISGSPLRHQARMAEKTSTQQGCDLHVISVMRTNPPGTTGLKWEQALYLSGWYTGLNHVKWCEVANAHPSEAGNEKLLPRTQTHCRQNDALQGAMMKPTNLPMRAMQTQFMSCMDSRAEYAIAGTMGGDAGEFIRGIAAVEKLIYRFIDADEIDSLLKRFVEQMQQYGRRYFCMCSDSTAEAAWHATLGWPLNQTKLNPLDAQGRRAMLRTAGNVENVGSAHLKLLLEGTVVKAGIRVNTTRHLIESFHGIMSDWFNPLRANLMYVIYNGPVEEVTTLLKIGSPTLCPAMPLVVPRLHTAARSESFVAEGSEASNAGGESATGGAGQSAHVYHYEAAAQLRMTMASFFGQMYGLDPIQIAAKMNLMAQVLLEAQATGATEYNVMFAG